MKTDKYYFAVRKTDGVEWVDINAWGHVLQTSIEYAKKTDEAIPHWSKDNQVVRFAQFELKELKY